MTTRRALRSTSPWRASLYRGRPWCFSAEIHGRGPTRSPPNILQRRLAAFRIPDASLVAKTWPSASPVAVANAQCEGSCRPLSASSKTGEFCRLAKTQRQTPVASGSRLPVCPAFAAPYRRFTICRARFELTPRVCQYQNAIDGRPRRCLPTGYCSSQGSGSRSPRCRVGIGGLADQVSQVTTLAHAAVK